MLTTRFVPVELASVPLTVATVGIRFPQIDVTGELKEKFEDRLKSVPIKINVGLSLGRDFLFLRAKDTSLLTIEGLGAALGSVLKVAFETLPINLVTRVGARYVNEFTHPGKKCGLKAWKELLDSRLFAVCGGLGKPVSWTQSIQADYGGTELLMRHGIMEGSPEHYFLDSDVYRTKSRMPSTDELEALLGEFQCQLYQIFRWSLKDSYFQFLQTG